VHDVGAKGPASLRRAAILKASLMLARECREARFIKTYSRNNPRLQIEHNAFYFGEPGKAPRAVIIGSSLYVHAPGARLPDAVQLIPRKVRLEKHLGGLHGRVRIFEEGETTIRRVINALKRVGDL
jgi:hypothetical protein